ncbi:branched-chain amino acid transport system substrate-binding protein [Marinobacter segnicrescens]|uniref:Branched-chain amino acid transport system substrate-binding protein n=1 Tax=Marinobacter segnicrescens TaxID=430453 RepID=A0A1I0GKV5_9GAMM|nr:ABC transporter substrate-binding protein [Marinobacter segnicrescens]SET71681.1 branched-chain amino acid transport system substrate-binding protein [Marinobacter segnicrescens]
MSGPLTRHRHKDTTAFPGCTSQGRHGWTSAVIALVWLLVSPVAMALPADTPVGRVELGAPKDQADATIACMYPMTGRSASYGRDSIVAIRMALQELARDPQSPDLRVIVDDSRSKASFAVRMAEDFLQNDDADILCGIVSSGVGMAVSRLARQKQVILIGTDHASSRATLEEGHDYYFRVSSDTWISHAAGARYLKELQKETGWRKLAFLGPDYEYGRVAWRDLQQALALEGVRFEQTGTYWPRLYEPDYSLYIQSLLENPPDILVVGLWGGDFTAFIEQARTTRLFEQMRVANFDTGGDYETLVALGSEPPPGLILSARHHVNWPDTDRNRQFVQDFHELSGRYPSYSAQGAWAGMMAIARAIRLAGDVSDTRAVITALEGLEVPLPKDPDGFTSYIDPQTHQIAQAQAIGTPVSDDRFPPARVLLGNWRVYDAESLKPSPALIQKRRGETGG